MATRPTERGLRMNAEKSEMLVSERDGNTRVKIIDTEGAKTN